MEILEEAAKALLVLVPKEIKPTSLKNFRPISMCNVRVKLVTKGILNGLKLLLKEMISPTQTSFILGWQSLDNAIICQEVVHSIRFTKSRNGGMVIKIDLEKAYDRMAWEFVEDTLKDASIPSNNIIVIMNLLRRSSCRLLWNGEQTVRIKLLRGLRQGDPFSPSMFAQCLERLSR